MNLRFCGAYHTLFTYLLVVCVQKLLISPIVSPQIVGKAATVLAIESLILSVLSLGIPTGVMRFLGKSHTHHDKSMLSEYLYSSLIFIIGLDVTAGLLFLCLGIFGGLFPSLDLQSIIFASLLILVGMNGWPLILASFFNSILETEYITIAQLITGISRICVGIPLVYIGLNFTGLMLGYLIAATANALTLLTFTKRKLREMKTKFVISSTAIKESLKAGLATWIPSILVLAGQWLGILSLRGFIGSYETGTYFIAYAITVGLLSFPINLLNLMFPVLSGMDDGRKRAMTRAVKIASAIMYPIAFILITYPALIPSILGESYMSASDPVRILAIGFLLAPIVNGYTYYAYALGDYRCVTIVGLAGNVPRIILYLLLIGNLAERGAAIAFSLGFFFSLVAVVPFSIKSGYQLNIKISAIILAIPLVAYILISVLKVTPLIGMPLIIVTSYLLYARLKIISKKDLQEISTALLSKEALSTLSPYMKPILRILYGE